MQGASRWVNSGEAVCKRRHCKQAEDADTLGRGPGAQTFARRRQRTTGGKLRPCHSATSAERGKPVTLPRESDSQEKMGWRVKDRGESGSQPVTGWIGVASQDHITPPERVQTSSGSSAMREPWLTDSRAMQSCRVTPSNGSWQFPG